MKKTRGWRVYLVLSWLQTINISCMGIRRQETQMKKTYVYDAVYKNKNNNNNNNNDNNNNNNNDNENEMHNA